MLDIKRVLGSAKSYEHEGLIDLMTPWGEKLDPRRVLLEHPRPQMRRERYTMLNGTWEYAITSVGGARAARRALTAEEALAAMTRTDAPSVAGAGTAFVPAAPASPAAFDGEIIVPFSPEAALSGVGRVLQPDELLWYHRTFRAPALETDQRLIVHFEAVDWTCACFVNGRLAATHTGGYLPFDVDTTPGARAGAGRDGDIELVLGVYDPSDAGVQPRGKQHLRAGGTWYTPQSGIWQSVWYEVVSATHLTSLSLMGDAKGNLTISADIAEADGALGGDAICELVVRDKDGSAPLRATFPVGGRVGRQRGARGSARLDRPHLWSPDDPHLYDAEVTLRRSAGSACADTVRGFCAFRTVKIDRDDAGRARLFLNGGPLFLKGVLDQGYWPDGLMTAPSDEALVHDIATMRSAGFNMLRKHIKIEAARWYYHCDRLGMLVFQDAISGGGDYSAWHMGRKPTLFKASWGAFRDDTPRRRATLASGDASYRREWTETCEAMVRLLGSHPSIVTWVLFNEGWGQFDARDAADRVHAIDPSRPIDAVSGWYDQHCGDYLSVHNYFRPLAVERDRGPLRGYAAERGCRASIISEFGGLTQPMRGHVASAHAYGYGACPTLDAWRAAVRHLLERADALEAQGLAGSVYTQLADVEDELNGILTSDRRVNKLKARSEQATDQDGGTSHTTRR